MDPANTSVLSRQDTFTDTGSCTTAPLKQCQTTGVSLEALMVRAATGDQVAFAELYDQLAPRIFGLVLRTVHDRARSEEVTQEVFVELWRIAARFDPARGSVWSFAATLAHRRAVDCVRSAEASRARETLTQEGVDLTVDPADVRLLKTERESAVRTALLSLSSPQRQAIELAYFEGMTYRQVATHVGAAEGTVKTRIRDGMTRLRRVLLETNVGGV